MGSLLLKGKKYALRSFMHSEKTSDKEKFLKTASENGNQMRSKGSNEVLVRIDTRRVIRGCSRPVPPLVPGPVLHDEMGLPEQNSLRDGMISSADVTQETTASDGLINGFLLQSVAVVAPTISTSGAA